MRTYTIDVIAGDGIGKEVAPAAVACIDAVAATSDFRIAWRDRDWGSDRYLTDGAMMPANGIEQLGDGDGVFLGAVGHTDIDDAVTLWGLLIPIRRAFDLYLNIRPIRLLPGVQPQYAGYVAWRGLVPEAALPAELHREIFEHNIVCYPDGDAMTAYPVPGPDNDVRSGHRSYNWVWYHPVGAPGLTQLCTDATGFCHGTAIAPALIRLDVILGEKLAAEFVERLRLLQTAPHARGDLVEAEAGASVRIERDQLRVKLGLHEIDGSKIDRHDHSRMLRGKLVSPAGFEPATY